MTCAGAGVVRTVRVAVISRRPPTLALLEKIPGLSGRKPQISVTRPAHTSSTTAGRIMLLAAVLMPFSPPPPRTPAFIPSHPRQHRPKHRQLEDSSCECSRQMVTCNCFELDLKAAIEEDVAN